MSLISKWKDYKESRSQKKNESNLKRIKNPKALKEDRAAAISYFMSYPDVDVAVPALLQRFEYSLEHGINDTREKESCLKGIVDFGESALPHIKKHLQLTARIAWPIKALNKLGSEEQVIEVLKSCLDFGEVSFDQAKVDKNYDILCYLVDFPLPGFVEKLVHFLNQHDERLRYAAVELMIEQDDPLVPEKLEHFLADESAENTRIRQAVIGAFLKNKWKLKNPGPLADKSLGGGILVNKQGILEKH